MRATKMFIPTEKESKIHYTKVKNGDEINYVLKYVDTASKCNTGLVSGQRQLIIISDEEIKDMEVGINAFNEIIKHDKFWCYGDKKIIASYLNIKGTLPIEEKDVEYMVNNVDCEVEIEEEQFFDICPDIDDVRSNKRPKLTNGFITLKFTVKGQSSRILQSLNK